MERKFNELWLIIFVTERLLSPTLSLRQKLRSFVQRYCTCKVPNLDNYRPTGCYYMWSKVKLNLCQIPEVDIGTQARGQRLGVLVKPCSPSLPYNLFPLISRSLLIENRSLQPIKKERAMIKRSSFQMMIRIAAFQKVPHPFPGKGGPVSKFTPWQSPLIKLSSYVNVCPNKYIY